ncbi:MAG: phosphatase PAP2 family protein [Candidatus Sericytochromatia bacterium]|nr:phosphatase PAP2 family protein [Candidatus Sericytochromatia bacterium]
MSPRSHACHVWRQVGALAVSLALATGCVAAPGSAPPSPQVTLTVDPDAGQWRPIVVADVARLLPGAPDPTRVPAEVAEVKARQAGLSPEERKAVDYWHEQPAPVRWSGFAHDLTLEAGLVPPRAARALAIAHAAIYDAVVATWAAKQAVRRAPPSVLDPSIKPLVAVDAGIPSFPSEQAAVSYAAAAALGEVLPELRTELQQRAETASEAAIAAGTALRSDVEAGRTLGEAVAAEVVSRARVDGSDARPTLPLAVQPGQWTHASPMEPLAGSWKPWLIGDVATYRLDRPAFPGEPGFQPGLDQVLAVGRDLTQAQKDIALKWNLDAPAAQWNDIIRPLALERRLSTPRAARLLGYAHVLMADAFIATWHNKYSILLPRPQMAAGGFKSFVPTPPHPSYPSGHSSCSMAAATYLGAVFPDERARVTGLADEAAVSRLYGGIHYERDNEDGKLLGRRIAEAVLVRARADGLP